MLITTMAFAAGPLPAATPTSTSSGMPAAGPDDSDSDSGDALPDFAGQVAFAPETFTQSPTIAHSSVTVHALNSTFEYQPHFLQKYGVFGVGVIGGLYFITPQGVVTNSFLDFYSVGAQLRYQLRYFAEQPVVPFFGYAAEYFRYHNINAGVQSISQNGPFLGLMFLLNDLDKDAMRNLYRDNGVSRVYAVAEARGSSSGDQTLPWSPRTWFFGVRAEF